MAALLGRLATALVVVVVAGLGTPAAAHAQGDPAPAGGITLTPAAGADVTLLGGTTSGPCTAAGANGLQVWVTGPGPFAPDDAAGRPFGVAVQAATATGFSTTAPNTFTSRAGFLDLAREVGLSAVPTGTYVIEFRCVDVEFATVFQTYRTTLTFTTPTTYSISGTAPGAGGAPSAAPAGSAPTGAGPAAPSLDPAGSAPGSPTDAAYGPVSRTTGTAGPGTALVVVLAIAAVLAAVALVHTVRRRRSRRAPATSSPRP